MPSRDSQRQQLYSWQHEQLSTLREVTLTLEDAQKLVNRICDEYGVPKVTVEVGRANLWTHSYYNKWNQRIVLAPSWGLNLRTVLHEVAHHVDAFQNNRVSSHGPTFLRVYIDLLAAYTGGGRDKIKMIETANRAGMYVAGQSIDFRVEGDTVVDLR